MSKLGQLLSYLDRPDVTELSFRSGAPAMMQVGNRQHPITVTPLRMAQLRRFFLGTPVMSLFPSGNTRTLSTHHLTLQGRPYTVMIRGNQSAVEIRVRIDDATETESASRASHQSQSPSPSQPTPPPQPHQAARRPEPDRTSPAGSPSIPASRGREPTPDNVPVSLPNGDRMGPARSRGEASQAYPMRSRSPDLTVGPKPPASMNLEIERNNDLNASHHGGHRSPDASSSSSRMRLSDVEIESDEDGRVRRPTPRTPPAASSSSSRMRLSDVEAESDEDGRVRRPTPRTPTVSNASAMPLLRAPARSVPSATPVPSPAPMPSPAPTPSAAPVPAAPPTAPAAPVVPVAPAPLPPPPMPSAPASAPEPEPERHALSGPTVEARTGDPVHAGLRQLLASARHQGASDIHIMANQPVRLRRAGNLDPIGNPIPGHQVKAMIEPLLTPSHAHQLAERGYTDLGVEIAGAGRLRLNVNRQRTGLKICIRLVVNEPSAIDQLGLPPEVSKLAAHHQGLALISGPNGHGKTTTMAAMVDLFNVSKAIHIITVEDPVEVIHPPKRALITQREVGTHTKSFTTALAAALREDPDVIAIGELRDRETVEMALSAAETGHLVLATMSTPSGAKTIDRVIDMFPPDDQSQVRATLSGALKLVISQRLLRRADGTGMVAAYEMITGNVPLWTLIRDNKLFQLPSLLQRGRNYGMIRLEDSLRELIAAGTVTEQEALLYAEDPRALAPPPKAEPTPPTSGWRFGRGR